MWQHVLTQNQCSIKKLKYQLFLQTSFNNKRGHFGLTNRNHRDKDKDKKGMYYDWDRSVPSLLPCPQLMWDSIWDPGIIPL